MTEDYPESRSTAKLLSNIDSSPEKITELDKMNTTPKRKVLVSKKNKHTSSRPSSASSKGSNKVAPKDNSIALYMS